VSGDVSGVAIVRRSDDAAGCEHAIMGFVPVTTTIPLPISKFSGFFVSFDSFV
jgi:hypothetical protein